MATKKISELTLLDTVSANLQLTVIPVLDTATGTTRKVTLQQINDSVEANIPFAAAAFTQANNANTNAITSGVYANAAFQKSNNSLNVSTGGSITGNIIVNGNVTANYFLGNGSLLTGISAGDYANAAYSRANTANTTADASYARANSANVLAQAAFDSANSRNYSNTNVALYLPTYTGNIAANIVKSGYTWEFGANGTTAFPNSVILAPVGQSITMQSDQYSQLMWENANVTVAPNMAINSNFYVAQNSATLDIGYRDGSSTQLIKSWLWSVDGTLTLPSEGKINGIGAGPAGDRAGYISWAGNTSGDGLGFNTMRLVPDQQGLEEADQYIILDPTSPGHIHIRAGGTQNNSQAILYFGGENSYVKIDSGPNPPVSIAANNNVWTFGTNGNLTFPDATVQSTAWTGIPGPYADDEAATLAGVALGSPYHKTGTGGQVFVRLTSPT
jgi:hypothetical protein